MAHDEDAIAGGGLLHRRSLLIAGAASAAAIGTGSAKAASGSPEWMKEPGAPLSGYGSRAPSSNAIQRIVGALDIGRQGNVTILLQLLVDVRTGGELQRALAEFRLG